MSLKSRLKVLAPVVLALASLVLSSCSTTPTAPTASGPAPSQAAASKPTGELKFAVRDFYAAVDPPRSEVTFYHYYTSAFFESLVQLDSDGKLQPALAERWEISPDAKSHTFYIRKGVNFHDGSDLTAADVKFSLERFIAPQTTHTKAAETRAAIASVELKDDYTVVVNLKQPYGDVIPSIFAFTGAGAVVPKKYVEAKGDDYFNSNPVGTGPWKVTSKTGTGLTLEAFENHWRATPKFKTVKVMSIPEEATRLAMLKTGELDVAVVETPDVAAQAKAAGFRVVSYNTGMQAAIGMNYDVDNPSAVPLGDVRVRKALSLALNRKEMSEKLFLGYATPAPIQRVGRTGGYYDPNVVTVDPYDPEQAKRLLTQAGYPNGFAIKDYVGTSDPAAYGQAIDGYWRAIGLKSETVTLENTAILGMFIPKLKPEIFGNTYSYFAPGTVGWANVAVYRSTGFFHNTKNAKLDELLDKIPGVRDPAEQKRLQQEASVLIKNEYSIVATIDPLTMLVLGKNVGEWKPTLGLPAFGLDFEKVPHAK